MLDLPTDSWGPRHLKLLITIGVAFFLGGCSSLTKLSDEERRVRDVRDEKLLGREIASRLVAYFGVDVDESAHRYLNLVGQTLAMDFARPELEFHFAVLASDENASYAAPGGYVFVTRGLLKTLTCESELAAVLAHEMAHVNERHLYLILRPKRDPAPSAKQVRAWARGGSELVGSPTVLANQGVRLLLESGLGEKAEQQADEAAMVYASSIGYHPRALQEWLDRSHAKRLGSENSDSRAASAAKFLDDNQLGNTQAADAEVLARRFQAALKK